jgi:hypothetical protein
MSLDGHHLAFATPSKHETVMLAVASAESGAIESEKHVPPTLDLSVRSITWLPDNRSMAFPDTRTGTPNLWSVAVLGEGPEKQLTHFTSGIIWDARNSFDGKSLVLARGSRQSDVVLFSTPK